MHIFSVRLTGLLRSRWLSLPSLLLLISCTHTPDIQEGPPPARISGRLDRVQIAVHNLTAITQHYRDALGFQLEPQTRSADGRNSVESRFSDGSSLELIGRDEGAARSSSESLNTFLDERQGGFGVRVRVNHLGAFKDRLRSKQIAFTESTIAKGSEKTQIVQLGSGPLSFLSFLTGTPPSPLAAHRNTALRLREVWIIVDSLSETESEWRSLELGPIEQTILQPMRAKALTAKLDAGVIVFVQRDHLETEALAHVGTVNPQITGVSVDIRDIESAGRQMKRGSSPVRHAIARYNEKSCLILAPKNAGGLFLELVKSR